MAHRLSRILLVQRYAMAYLVVTSKKNRLTLQPVAMILIPLFLLTLDKHMCTDLKLEMAQ
jgi:hypothetical protein